MISLESWPRPAKRPESPRPAPTDGTTRRHSFWRTALLILAAPLLVLSGSCVHRILDSTRGVPVVGIADPAQLPHARDSTFPAVLAVLTGTQLDTGHHVEIVTAGDSLFMRMFRDLRGARRSIFMQSYYCLPGRVADTTAAILVERARNGVRTLFLADGFGCRKFVGSYGRQLRAAGVHLATLRPLRWHTLHDAQHRSHVRLAIIDGTVAYTGGFGLDDKWLYPEGDQPPWRDTGVRFTGPAIGAAQAAFIAAWSEATGTLPMPQAGPATDEHPARAGVQYHVPGFGTTSGERLLLLAVRSAERSLFISNAYFVPNTVLRGALADAAARGVDVRVLTAGARSDVPTTRFAARAHYGELLAAGVRIHEFGPTMMHAKTLVADGVLVVVGSMNFDNRSLRIDDELNLVVHDTAVAGALERAFFQDLQHSVVVTPATHAARSRFDRLREWLARLAQPLL